jgi:hypothetical protein
MFGKHGIFGNGDAFVSSFIDKFECALHYYGNHANNAPCSYSVFEDTLGKQLTSLQNVSSAMKVDQVLSKMNGKFFYTVLSLLVTCLQANTVDIPHSMPVSSKLMFTTTIVLNYILLCHFYTYSHLIYICLINPLQVSHLHVIRSTLSQ